MEQLRTLHDTTVLHIEGEKEQIKKIYNSGKKAMDFLTSATTMVIAADYSFKTYRIVKKVAYLFRKKKK